MASGLGFRTLMKGLHRRNSELLKFKKKYKNTKNQLKYKISNKKLNFKKLSEKELVKFIEDFKRKIRKETRKELIIGIFITLGLIITFIYLFYL